MYVLQIEYPIADYDAWKAAFDDDRLDRAGSGVRRYRILQPTDDPNYVVIDLEFDDVGEAEAYLAAAARRVFIAGSISSRGQRSADADRRGGGDEGVLTQASRGSPIDRSA
jgi:hypothetical protein